MFENIKDLSVYNDVLIPIIKDLDYNPNDCLDITTVPAVFTWNDFYAPMYLELVEDENERTALFMGTPLTKHLLNVSSLSQAKQGLITFMTHIKDYQHIKVTQPDHIYEWFTQQGYTVSAKGNDHFGFERSNLSFESRAINLCMKVTDNGVLVNYYNQAKLKNQEITITEKADLEWLMRRLRATFEDTPDSLKNQFIKRLVGNDQATKLRKGSITSTVFNVGDDTYELTKLS